MRPHVWMVAALVITLLAPLPDVVGQLKMTLRLAPDTASGSGDDSSPAGAKRAAFVIDASSGGAPIQIQKLTDAVMAIESVTGKRSDRSASPESKWFTEPTRNRSTTDDSDRPIVYRAGRLPADLPGWFDRLDRDRDGQVGLYEWRDSDWPVEDFQRLDRNGDGFLTIAEIMSAVTEAQARGVPNELLARQLSSDFRPVGFPLQLVQAGEAKLLDTLPPGLKVQKLEMANGLEQGLKLKKMDPADGFDPGIKVKKMDSGDVPPIKGKGSKPDRPGKEGL